MWLAPLWDELTSSFPSLGSASVQTELGLNYTGLSTVLFVAPFLLALLVEAPLLAWSERVDRRRFVAVAHLVMAVALAGAAVAEAPWMFAAGLAVWGSSGGVGLGAAQAELMAHSADRRARAMTRWTLFAGIGDAAAPAVFAGIVALGGGWREALGIAAGLVALYAGVIVAWGPRGRVEVPAVAPASGIVPQLRKALRHRALLGWLGAAALCGLLDEIFLAFGTLRIHRDGGGALVAATAFFGCSVAGVLALAIVERLLRRWSDLTVLIGSSAVCASAYGAWVITGWLGLLILVGASAAPLYPIAKSRAYAALPDAPGVVAAAGAVFTPFDLLMPLGVGWCADQWGLTAALCVLALQPLGLLWVGMRARKADVTARIRGRAASP